MPAALRWRGRAALVALFWAGVVAFFVPSSARADGLRGTVEYGYNLGESKTRNAGTEEVRSDVNSFVQRYRLNFDRTLYPYLMIRGGGLFEKTDSVVETGGIKSDSALTRTNPFAELLLANPMYSAAFGYNRQEEKQQGSGVASKLIRELYNARLGWQPVNLPTLNVQFTRTDTHDPQRTVEDSTRETVQLGSTYKPVKSVDLIYQGTMNRTDNRVGGVEMQEVVHNGQINYGDRFLAGRLSLNSNYSVSNRRTETRATQGSEVTVPVQVFAGFSAFDDTPLVGALDPTPALIDGNLTVSAGIDIGLPASADPNGSSLRNLGLDLLQPAAELNGLRVWVDRALPAEVAGSFRWTVYVSADNLGWTLWQTGVSAPFGPFENRFEIRFPKVGTRYVKVAVAPLAATVVGALSFPNIFITELQGILTLPPDQVKSDSSQTSHMANVAAKARLLDDPNLFYDFSLFYTRNEQPSTVSRMLISNGLSLSRRLNRWLSGSAQAARDDADEPGGHQRVYRYGASLNATPLRTLTHSMVYSGRVEKVAGVGNVRNSIFINNRATLYRGIDLLMNGGANDGHREDGERTRSYLVNVGSEIKPHSTLSWGLFGSADRSERSGGPRPALASSTRRARTSVTWNPLTALNLFASTEVVSREEGSTTLHNWSLNWSPFRDGTLQMSFTVSETLRPQEDGSDRTVSPSLRWEIRKGTFFDLSYSLVDSKARSQDTQTRVLSGNLQANF